MSNREFNYKIDNLNETIDNEIKILLNKDDKIINKNILVLSGGGVKGMALIGALKALEDLDILKHIKTIASSSVGAIIGLFFIAGYNPEEMFSVLKRVNLGNIKSINPLDLIEKFGMDNGKKLTSVLTLMLKAKKFNENITFKEFYKKTNLKMYNIYANVCQSGLAFQGQTQKKIKNYLNEKLNLKEDWILSADEALDHGFIDGIVGAPGFENMKEIKKWRHIQS